MINRLLCGLAAILLLPATAAAATYSAKPTTPVTAKRIVARDINWACSPAACQGSTLESRPLVLCQALAKQAGPLENFIVNGSALPVAELDKCNRAARGGPAPTLARN